MFYAYILLHSSDIANTLPYELLILYFYAMVMKSRSLEKGYSPMKFAYLIMAHNRFDILKLLLQDLDDARNDIFLHIDRKAEKYDEQELRMCIHSANLIILKPTPVYWGDYSQIRCILNLLKVSTQYAHHDFYHLLAGVEFPIKSQEYIYHFFEANQAYEFVGFNDDSKEYLERLKYFYFFRKYARYRNLWERFWGGIGYCLVPLQKFLGINRIKHCTTIFKKGYANWSISHPLACFLLQHEAEIRKRYRYTFCTDEVFIQTLVYQSDFYGKVYDPSDEYHSTMNLNTWEDPRNQYHMKDLPMLLKSDRLFAKKFDGDDAIELITKLKEQRL